MTKQSESNFEPVGANSNFSHTASNNTYQNDYSSIACDESQTYENLTDDKRKTYHSPPRVSPNPPQIQQFSGVLSKSLFSVVLKPQPLKPTVEGSNKNLLKTKSPPPPSSSNLLLGHENHTRNSQLSLHVLKSNMSTLSTSSASSSSSSYKQQINMKPSKNVLRNSSNNKLLLKKKCVSTTNLKFDSLANSSLLLFNDEAKKSSSTLNKSSEQINNSGSHKASSKSVSFLNNLEQCEQLANE